MIRGGLLGLFQTVARMSREEVLAVGRIHYETYCEQCKFYAPHFFPNLTSQFSYPEMCDMEVFDAAPHSPFLFTEALAVDLPFVWKTVSITENTEGYENIVRFAEVTQTHLVLLEGNLESDWITDFRDKSLEEKFNAFRGGTGFIGDGALAVLASTCFHPGSNEIVCEGYHKDFTWM